MLELVLRKLFLFLNVIYLKFILDFKNICMMINIKE